MVRFKTMEERKEVLYSGPYTVANHPAIVKPWQPNFHFHEAQGGTVVDSIAKSTTQLLGLSRIGSTLGKPLCASDCTATQSRISNAGVMVEVDVTRPLVKEVLVEDPLGSGI